MVITILILFLVPIGILSIFATQEARNTVLKGMLVAIPALGLILLPMYLADRGYQVGWDADGIYARMPGFRFEAAFHRGSFERDYERRAGIFGWLSYPPVTFMRYGDVTSIGGLPADKGVRKRATHKPNSTVYIAGSASPAGLYNDLIAIDLDSFGSSSVHEFMSMLRSRRPDLMPASWIYGHIRRTS